MARKKTDAAAAETTAPAEAAPKPTRKKKAEPVPPAPPAPVEAAAPAPAPERRRPTREQIAERARAHWRDGSADSVANWLRAERELDQELNRRD